MVTTPTGGAVNLAGSWDGTAIAPVASGGWWNGTAVQPLTPKLLGEWGFLDNLADTSGNGHTAVATAYTPAYIAGPQAGTRGLQFSGTGQTISYGRTGLEPAAAAGGVCTMGWVNLNASNTAFLGVLHKSRDGAGSTRAGFMLYVNKFRPFARWREQLAFADGIGSVINGTGWHHMAVVDADDRYEWYLDGVSVGTAARTGTGAVSWEAFNWISGFLSGDCQSGAQLAISGMRIFSGSLTTAEVNAWMNTPITAPAVGVNHTVSQADAEGLTDSPSLVQNHGKAQVDPLGLADSAVAALAHTRLATDALGLTDTKVASLALVRTQADPLSMTDTANVALFRLLPITASDTIGLADSTTGVMELVLPVGDLASLSDAGQVAQGHGRSTVESVAVTDNAVVSRGLAQPSVESLGLSDLLTIARGLSHPVFDGLSLTDTANMQLLAQQALAATDALGLTDNALLQLYLLVPVAAIDSLGLSDARLVASALATVRVGPVGLSDTVTRAMGLGAATVDAAGLTDAVSLGAVVPLVYGDLIGLTDPASVLLIPFMTSALIAVAQFGPGMDPTSARLDMGPDAHRIAAGTAAFGIRQSTAEFNKGG